MTIRVAINGFGRIGRGILRAHYENCKAHDIQVVAINDMGDIQTYAHLTQYDTAHGKFPGRVSVDSGDLVVNGDAIRFLNVRDPSELPWSELGIDVVLECTGVFASQKDALVHLNAGAKKVIISAIASDEVDATIVFGVNDAALKATDTIISNASCSINCIAPIAKTLNDKLGIVAGMITSIHAYTNEQALTDRYHDDVRRARSATMSMIPISTGAASSVGLVLPELKGKFSGLAIRVPTINVSAVDMTFMAGRDTTVDEVNSIMKEASTDFNKILGYNVAPLVSVDFNHNSASGVFDATQTQVSNGRLVKVFAWYDNEWGFSNRMLDTTVALMNAGNKFSKWDKFLHSIHRNYLALQDHAVTRIEYY